MQNFHIGEFPMRQSNFTSDATSPCKEVPYAEFLHREIPYAPVQFWEVATPL